MKVKVKSTLFLGFMFFSSIISVLAVHSTHVESFEIKEGDNKKFIFKKHKYPSLFRSPLEQFRTDVLDENGNEVNITISNGTIVIVDIIAVSNENVTFRESWDGTVLEEREVPKLGSVYDLWNRGGGFLWNRPWFGSTDTNKTYWEIKADEIANGSAEVVSCSIEGALFICKESSIAFRINYKTGWLSYYWRKTTVYEIEISEEAHEVSGFQYDSIFILLLASLVVITIRKKDKGLL